GGASGGCLMGQLQRADAGRAFVGQNGAIMDPLANINGETMPLSQVRIPALDRGFLFGDAIYEVLRVYGGKPWLADGHFARLRQSLDSLRILHVNVDRLRDRATETLTKSGVKEGLIYI